MIRLSDRLAAIAGKVNKGETMADIGTDHGFLPFYLVENEISPKVILCDISKGSLAKAKSNMIYLSDDSMAEARLGDGLAPLKPGEVDDIVIAGLGSTTMTGMLADDPALSKSFKKYIMQPRKDPGELRWFLYNNGFVITDETLVVEGKFICEIITASPVDMLTDGRDCFAGYDIPGDGPLSIRWEVPEYYAGRRDDLSREYVSRKLEREKQILASKIERSGGRNKETTEENIRYLEDIAGRM